MPQFVAPFTIKDGSATPADVTYSPERLSSGDTLLVDRRLPVREQNPTIHIAFAPPVKQRPSYKHEIEVVLPVVRVISGAEVVKRPLRARLVFDLSTDSTEQERKHLQAAVVNASNHALLKAGVMVLDPLY